MTRYHHVFLCVHAAVLCLVALACEPGGLLVAVDLSGQGGGATSSSSWPYPGAVTASAGHQAVAVASSSASAGGHYPANDGGCPTCAAALHGPDHEGAEASFCADSEAFASWASFIACGCNAKGSCYLDCGGGMWCNGVYPKVGAWTDPAGSCATCLGIDDTTGCGQQRALCEKT